ncbi:hypothetical protein [Lacimicrobium alkaliphilum]|uniref:Uncharacterized protein n=1 Tax=Lacimicrobium alkaliphilum TaxID=1526571 RepID=A0ABQ1RR12_9ALTE|nr:hypothetical protein [Lacimicrobium alkaliphilum]GGD75283.1 hypothetical protein GCM10011357_32860 [Lacimicrobium alkaliphilum]
MRYILVFALSFSFVLASIGVINWVVDPFGMYWSPVYQGVNATKPEAGNRSRVSKAYRSVEAAPQVLLLGNSRIEMGIDPEHELFKTRQVYNLGMPGASLSMQLDYGLNVIHANKTVKEVILSVDFLDFLSIKSPNVPSSAKADYNSRLPYLSSENSEQTEWFMLKEKMAMTLSLDALSATIRTLISQNSQVSSITSKGFNTAQEYRQIVRLEGVIPLFNQKLDEIEQRLDQENLVFEPESEQGYSKEFSKLRTFISALNDADIRLTIFTSPYHYSYLQVLSEKGYWQDFMKWKTYLAALKSHNESIDIWDFSGFSQFSLEPVPVPTPHQEMDFYWEPAHYKSEVGDLILQRMKTGEPDHFGHPLNEQTIETIIRANNEGLLRSQAQWDKLKSGLGR